MGYCPFMSTMVDSTALSTVECVQTQCQIWNSANSECSVSTVVRLKTLIENVIGKVSDLDEDPPGTKLPLVVYLKTLIGKASERDEDPPGTDLSLVTYLKKMLGVVSERDEDHASASLSFIKQFTDVVGSSSETKPDPDSPGEYDSILEEIQDLDDYQMHVHDSHLHTVQHDVDDVPATKGPPNTIVPAAGILVQEFMGNEDLDSNGAIYGFDFMIDPTDTNKPATLPGLEQSPDWTTPVCVITWQQYLNWIATGSSPC